MSDVIKFPKKQEQLQKEAEAAQAADSIPKLNLKRKNGLQLLNKKVQDLLENDGLVAGEHATKELVMAVRDLRNGLDAASEVLEAQNKLIDYILHDVPAVVQGVEVQSQNNFLTSAHLQTLMALLRDGGVITEEGMKDKWNQLMKENMKEAGAEVTSEQDSEPQAQ